MIQKYSVRTLTLCLLLAALLLLFAFLLLANDYWAATTVVALLAITTLAALIREQNKTNRQLALFFESIKFEDFNASPRMQESGQSFRKLSESLEALGRQFTAIRETKESQFQFSQNILHNVGVGIIALTPNNDIEFTNRLFHGMMHVPYCTTLEKLEKFDAALARELQLCEQRKKRVFRQEQNGVIQNFLFVTSMFVVNSQSLKLVVVQNIQPTIDQTEMEAWQKLIRVLTHEIMNSITPISSLAATAASMLANEQAGQQLDAETFADMREALQTINRRSEGLIHFVQQYRNLTAIPQPTLAIVSVEELFLRVGLLFRAEYADSSVEFVKEIHGSDLEVVADASLIEQVIINLLKNAFQAVEHRNGARIQLSAHENEFNRIEIVVSDNGNGILPEVIDKIFIPFFTTKPQGSGIGLSLSKQIMLMHGGNIVVHSTTGKGSEFILRF